MARVLRESSVKQKGREAATTFAAALLHTYPMHFPAILFDSTDYTMYKGKERKSLSWHFTQLRAIDIQITLASIREQVGTPGYQSIENRLIVSHHVLVAFIHFLNGRNFRDFLERPEDVQAPLPYTHKVVLKIRDEMSECLRKTIKYLCDRYEDGLAAVFKDNGSTLPSIRTMIDDNKAATLMSHEPLVVASVDALACWLEQDASVKLREDAADMMDVLLKLYNPNPALRMPIIAIVEHTLGTSHGMENFALRRGWEIFFRDFESIVLPDQPAAAGKPDDKTIARGSRILHVFAAVSDYGLRYHRQLQGTPQADRWNEILQLTTRLNSEGASALWDLKLALLNTMSDLVNLAAERKVITVESGRVRDVVKRVDRLLRTARRG